MHFFRALWADDLISAGFTVKNSDGRYLFYKDIVEEKNRLKYLKYSEKLSIIYNAKLSNIVFIKEKVYFDKDGHFDQSGTSISWEGEMLDQRVGDMLPYTYNFR